MKPSSVFKPIADGGLAADDRQEFAEFNTMVGRTLSNEGIVLFGITYNSGELAALKKRMSDDNVNVRFNRDDLRRVLVSPSGGTECVLVENTAGIDDAVALDEWVDAVAAIERAASRGAVDGELVRPALDDLREQGQAMMSIRSSGVANG
jgi:hypothetical protein